MELGPTCLEDRLKRYISTETWKFRSVELRSVELRCAVWNCAVLGFPPKPPSLERASVKYETPRLCQVPQRALSSNSAKTTAFLGNYGFIYVSLNFQISMKSPCNCELPTNSKICEFEISPLREVCPCKNAP